MNTSPGSPSVRRRRGCAAVLLVLVTPACLAAQDRVLSLGDAMRLARQHSPRAVADGFVVAQATARVAQARAAFLPALSATIGNRQRTFNSAELGIELPTAPGAPPLFDPAGEVLGPINLYDARARVTQQLFAPAARAQWQAAQALERAAAADAESSQAAIGLQVATAYVRLQRALAHVEARRADSALAAELLATAREQLQAGVGIALDVTRAESQVASARAQLIASLAEADHAQLELARVVGLELDAMIRPSRSLAPGDTGNVPTAAAAMELATAHRTELRAFDARRVSLQQQVRAVRAERLPAFSAFADNGVIGREPDQLRYTYSWGLQLSMPLFDARRSARSGEQAAALQEVEARLRDLERAIEVEVRSALIELGAARAHVEAAQVRVALGEREVTQARDRFTGGVAGNADVVSASLALNAARSALVDALAARERARVMLAHAQGVLFELP